MANGAHPHYNYSIERIEAQGNAMPENDTQQTRNEEDRVTSPPSESSDGPTTAEVNPSLSVDEGGAPFLKFYRPPKLGIAHLLAWMTVTAVLMKVTIFLEQAWPWPESLPVSYGVMWRAIVYSNVPVHAAGLVGVAVLLRDKWRGAAGRLQPGHWLLAIFSISGLLQLTILVLSLLALRDIIASTDAFFTPYRLISVAAPQLLAAMACLQLTIRGRLLWRWRILFGLLVIVAFASAAQYLCALPADTSSGLRNYDWHSYSKSFCIMYGIASLLTCFALLLAVLVDFVCRSRRDGLHWMGVLLVAWGTATALTWWVASIVISGIH